MSFSVTLLTPKNNAKLNLLPTRVQKYIRDTNKALSGFDQRYLVGYNSGVNVIDYYAKRRMDTRSNPIKFSFAKSNDEEIILTLVNDEYKITKTYQVKGSSIKVFNLIPGFYKWYVASLDGKRLSNERSFVVTNEYRQIYVHKGFNIRDIGGKKTNDGKKVRYGLVYRGIEFTFRGYRALSIREEYGSYHQQLFSQKDLPFLRELNLGYDLDLRGSLESRKITDSPLNKYNFNVTYTRASINAYVPFMIHASEEYPLQVTKEIFEAFANADKKPVYVHCWGGADRTGTLIFLLEAFLGCKMTDFVIDYELTTFGRNICRVLPYDERYDNHWRKDNSMASLFDYVISNSKDNETVQEFATNFLINTAKIPVKTLNKIKKLFLK